MRNHPAPEMNSTRTVTVLSVSPLAEDYFSLQAVFSHSRKALYRADSLASALAAVRRWEIGVVICERNLSPGTWIDLLDNLRPLPNAPPLIVTSRLADENLWAEALNLGAYDVLAKPFAIEELVRSVNSAWLHWYHQREADARAWNALRAAS
ncbi:MAG: response regulator [Candidatus Solibacter sp.]|jgi:DNA-binding response OmpR family regulator